jgi:hypothetical protein
MDHLGFIAVSYAVGILVPVVYAAAAWSRMTRAARRLAAIDPRRQRTGRRTDAARP